MKSNIHQAIELLRRAVSLLEQAEQEKETDGIIIIPDADPGKNKASYCMGIKPGAYHVTEVSEAIQFISDMLE